MWRFCVVFLVAGGLLIAGGGQSTAAQPGHRADNAGPHPRLAEFARNALGRHDNGNVVRRLADATQRIESAAADDASWEAGSADAIDELTAALDAVRADLAGHVTTFESRGRSGKADQIRGHERAFAARIDGLEHALNKARGRGRAQAEGLLDALDGLVRIEPSNREQVTMFDAGAMLDPAMLDPAMLDPAMLDPAMLDPAMLDPAMLDPTVAGVGEAPPAEIPVGEPAAAALQPNLPSPPVDVCVPGSVEPLCAPAPEGPFEPVVLALNAELGQSPYRIYDYVRDEIEVDFYNGMWKSPTAIIQSGRGGVHEQPALLVAMLRAAGVPCTYATGWVYFPYYTLLSWFRQEVGMQYQQERFTTIERRDEFGNYLGLYVQMTWVEAWVPSSEMVPDQTGYHWVPLLPQFTPRDEAPGYGDITNLNPFDESDFLSRVQIITADDHYRDTLAAALAAAGADYSVDEIGFQSTPQKEDVGVLPATLPLEVAWSDNVTRAAALDAGLMLRMRITVSGAGEILASADLDMVTNGLERLTVSWAAATPEDQAIIDANGGLVNTPVAAVQLKPYIRGDGVILAEGTPVNYGALVNIKASNLMAGVLLNEVGKSSTNAGAVNTFVFDGTQFSAEFLAEREAGLLRSINDIVGNEPVDHREDLTGELLFVAGVKYLLGLRRSTEQIAELHHFQWMHEPQHIVLLTKVDSYYLADRLYYLVPRGAVLDAWAMDGRLRPLTIDYSDFGEVYRVYSFAASALEHMLWEYYQQVESVSTTKLLQLANEMGMPVHDFPGGSDGSVIFQTLQLSSSVESFIVTFVDAGFRATVHESPITLNQWSGAGFMLDNGDGYFGMYISGDLVAGITADADAGNEPDLSSVSQATVDHPSVDLSDRLAGIGPGETGSHLGGAATQSPPLPLTPAPAQEASGEDENNLGDPVNLTSGNLYQPVTDVRISSVGFDLIFSRDYNSNLDYSGPMGQRWTHVYDTSVMPTGIAGELRLIDGTGGTAVYTEGVTPGVYEGPPGVHATITYAAPSYVHTDKFGFSNIYDEVTGRLQRMEDRNGNVRTLTYAGNRLVSVADGFGASLTFAYDANDRITAVTDHTGRAWTYAHDADGNLVGATSPSDAQTAAATTSYAYDATSRMTGLTDPEGNTLVIEYYPSGNVRRQTFADGGIYEFMYDLTFRNETQVIDPAGNPAYYTFDDAGNQVQYIDANGVVWRYEFDGDRNRTASTDPLGHRWALTFDDRGNMLTRTNPAGHVTTHTYDPVYSQLLTRSDERGIFDTRTYDAFGNLLTVSDADGDTVTYTYDGNGNRLSMTDPEGFADQYEYDANGRLVAAVNRAGFSSAIGYDEANRLVQVSRTDGSVVAMTYDALDRQLTLSVDGVLLSSGAYDRNGNMTTKTNEDGTIAMEYDGMNRLVRRVDVRGNVLEQRRDLLGRVVGHVFPDGAIVNREFDPTGRVLRSVSPTGGVSTYAYDARGLRTAAVDALGNETTYVYDALSRLVALSRADGNNETYVYTPQNTIASVTHGDSGTIGFEYDGDLNVVAMVDERNNRYEVSYDGLNRVATVTDPSGGVVTTTYTGTGRIATRVDPDGRQTTYAYDAADQLVRRAYLDNGGAEVDAAVFTYDMRGNVLSMSDTDASVVFTYDARSRVVTASTDGSSQPVTTMSYVYADDLVASMIGPAGGLTTYVHDGYRRLTAVTNPLGEVTHFTRSPYGRTSTTFANGAVQSLAFDRAQNVAAVLNRWGDSDLGSFAYGYDGDGNPVSRDTAGDSRTWSYDEAGRLAAEQSTNASIGAGTWTYDLAGNRTGASGAVLTHDASDQLLSDGTYTYEYDLSGNRTRRTEIANALNRTDYAYDHENHLVGVTAYQNGALVHVYSYSYDPFGRRTQRTVDGQVVRYVYDRVAKHQIAAEYDGNDNLVARYTYGAGSDEVVSMERGGASYFYHTDAMGTVTAITDEAGMVVQRYAYDAFGNIRFAMDPSFEQPFGFIGCEHDPSGLVFMRARHYDPLVGRFLQRDPIGHSGGSNLYVYADNSPLRRFDRFGLNTENSFVGALERLGKHEQSKGDASNYADSVLSYFEGGRILAPVGDGNTKNGCPDCSITIDGIDMNYFETGYAGTEQGTALYGISGNVVYSLLGLVGYTIMSPSDIGGNFTDFMQDVKGTLLGAFAATFFDSIDEYLDWYKKWMLTEK